MMDKYKFVQTELDLFLRPPVEGKMRLSEVAPQLPHASPFKRGDWVKWKEWVTTFYDEYKPGKNGAKGRTYRRSKVVCVEQRGRILGRVKGRNFGWWVQNMRGDKNRSILMDIEMRIDKRPCRSK